MQESLKSKPRRFKGEIIEIHGGRIIRSTGVKDRHSKVRTARGPRDRRLRLSPNTAIQFYDVQDRLGYDRPSKALDWLMKEAKSAIDALDQPPVVMRSTAQHPSFSYTNDEFNSMNYDALNPSPIFNWNEGLGGGGGVFINYSQQDLEQNQICFQREPLQSNVNNYHPLSTPLITTVGFAQVVTAVPPEDKIPVFSKLQSASTFPHYQS